VACSRGLYPVACGLPPPSAVDRLHSFQDGWKVIPFGYYLPRWMGSRSAADGIGLAAGWGGSRLPRGFRSDPQLRVPQEERSAVLKQPPELIADADRIRCNAGCAQSCQPCLGAYLRDVCLGGHHSFHSIHDEDVVRHRDRAIRRRPAHFAPSQPAGGAKGG
jgi:hypothetical protein